MAKRVWDVLEDESQHKMLIVEFSPALIGMPCYPRMMSKSFIPASSRDYGRCHVGQAH